MRVVRGGRLGAGELPSPPMELPVAALTPTMIARSHGVGDARWSPSGRAVGWLDSWDSRTDLLIAPSDGSAPPSVVTADHAVSSVGAWGGAGWCWLDDDRVLLAAADGRLLVLRADGGGLLGALTTEGSATAPAASPDGRWALCVVESADALEVQLVPTDGSAPPVALSTADFAWDPVWSPDGGRIAWHEWDLDAMSWQSSRIVVAEVDPATGSPRGGPRVVAGGPGIAVGQPRWSPDGTRLGWISDSTGWWNIWIAGPDGADATPLHAEDHDHAAPAWGPGQRSWVWAPDSSAIASCRNESGYGRLVVTPLDGAGPRDVAKAFHLGMDWGRGGILAARSGAKTPTQIVVTDPSDGTRRVLARGAVAGFEAAGLVEPEPVQWESDGGIVHGMLRRPFGDGSTASGPGTLPPLFVHVHGGPTDQAVAQWNPRLAWFASRGWAVLSVDHRGSTGHGRAYRDALAGAWGVHDVADVVAGIRHAGAAGWCDPDRVVIGGGSAGGFTALLVCALHPDVVRAGVSLYGVADLHALAASTHRFEAHYLDTLVGPLPDAAAHYRARSPLTHAERMRVPMLVLAGSNDPVVPLAQAEAMVAAMRAAGAPVEYHVYEGEGHGFRRLVNVVDELTRTTEFCERVVGAP